MNRQAGITDELYWNLRTAKAVVAEGKRQGLDITFYDPGVRTIRNGEDPRTNWSVGGEHAAKGGYVVEIHYDASAPQGIGAGIIPAVAFGCELLGEGIGVGASTACATARPSGSSHPCCPPPSP